MWKWILGGIASVIVGVFLLVKYYRDVPPLEQLTQVTGDVVSAEIETRRSRRSTSRVLAVRIDDKDAYYPERFPEFDRIAETVKPGERVTAWVDVANYNYIWQLEKGGERLVSYDQVVEAQRSNNRWNALFGLLFLVVGVGTLGVMGWQLLQQYKPAAIPKAQ